jgi:hypothetical protein
MRHERRQAYRGRREAPLGRRSGILTSGCLLRILAGDLTIVGSFALVRAEARDMVSYMGDMESFNRTRERQPLRILRKCGWSLFALSSQGVLCNMC